MLAAFLKKLKPVFWDYEDAAAGPYKRIFNFRRMWKGAVLLTSVVTLAPLIFFAVVDYNVSQQAVETEITYQTARLVSNTRRNITSFLAERQSALGFIDKDNSFNDLKRPERLEAILNHLTKAFGGFTDLGVIDDAGVQRTYVGPYGLAEKNYSGQEWFNEVVGSGVYISDVFMGFRQIPHLVIAVKHSLPEGGFYVLRASIDTQRFDEMLSQVEVMGQGEMFLINRQGILQTPTKTCGNALEPCPLSVPAYSERTQVYETVYKGMPLVIGYAYIRDTQFILMAVKQKAELLKRWHATRRKIIAFLGISITAILVVILKTSTYLVNRIHEADLRRIQILHQLEYDNKMASLGRLSAGVAHEINNPLAIINEKAGLIKDLFTYTPTYANDSKLMKLVDSILYSIERCATITRRLLSFARHVEDAAPQTLQIEEVIREVLGFLGKECEYRSIAVRVDVSPHVPPLTGDRGRLQEIFLNLANNSVASMKAGGQLTITVTLENDHAIAVRVADTGCGIPEKYAHRIFEPFFTTKGETGGTGLGLSITYALVQESGGSIRVQSQEGKGTTFTVVLPITMPERRKQAA
jgi:signal transduction histidine kinase